MLNAADPGPFPKRKQPEMVEVKSHYLYPGNLVVSARPRRVTTILGSCVAVCLFEPKLRIGAICHYLLPLWNGNGLPTPRYGNVAIDTMLARLQELGGQIGRMQAKVFGGAAMWDNGHTLFSIGDRNVEIAWQLLAELRIPVLASSVGGDGSRKIVFDTGSGEILLRCSRSTPPPDGR